MKILFLTTSFTRFQGDGTAPFVKSIADGMVTNGNEVIILAPFDIAVDNSYHPRNLEIHRFKYFPLKSWHIMGHARAMTSDVKLKLKTYFLLPFFVICQFINGFILILQNKIDLIYVHWVLPNGLAGAILSLITGKKLLISLHGSDIFLAKKNKLFKLVAKFIFYKTAKVTACSKELYSDAVKLGAKEKVNLIEWGVDPYKFFPSDSDYFLKKLSFTKNKNDFYILALGRLVYKKGFDNLILACENLLKINNNLKLIIGGSGDLFYELKTLITSLNLNEKVFLIGEVTWNEVVEFLRIGDLFVLPSVKDESGNMDGLPTVLLEAMATSLPIIASDIGGVNLVISDNVNGLLVKSGDINLLTKKIDFIINHPIDAKRIAKQARKDTETKYNWKIVTKKIEDIIVKEKN